MRPLVAVFLALGTACHPAPPIGSAPASSSMAAAAHASPPIADASAAPTYDDALSDEALCALPVGERVPLDRAREFAPRYPGCAKPEFFCDTNDLSPDPNDTCFVANQNIARAERSARQRAEAPLAGVSKATGPWDGKTPPKYLDRIDAHFHLTPVERGRLSSNGFVVLDRLLYADYAQAFHDIFQEELPVYVGIDPALHAVFRGTELVLAHLEKKTLKPALFSLLGKLRGGLRAARPHLRPETALDLDTYLGIARALAGREHPGGREEKLSVLDHEEAVAQLYREVQGSAMTDPEVGIELFGRRRVIDFSQLAVRGHYADVSGDDNLDGYFQSIMWLSRLEFNLVSRSCRSSQPGGTVDPEETPREARDALALAEIVEQSGALSELRLFEKVYGVFAGRREDVSVPDILQLAHRHGLRSSDPHAPEKLKGAIGDDFQRTAQTHFMPQGSTVLPAIATLLGPRIVPDTAPLTQLVHDRVPDRWELGAADVAYVLGHDGAKRFLRSDFQTHPALQQALDSARAETARGAAKSDIYAQWLRTLLAIGAPPVGVVPSFFGKAAYEDFRMNSALVGYAQLRHTFVLLAAQGYDAYGCEIPDGYVEPLVPAWNALLAYVRKVRSIAPGFVGLERVLTMLRDIAQTESTGAALSESQRQWLAMVAESVPTGGYVDSGAPPLWTGWYFDMFEDREHGASRTSALVADYFTLTNVGKVKYLGTDGPRLGIFIVDTGGEPRAMVGPVAKGYEAESPIAERLNDEKALALAAKSAPWRTSFAVPASPPPPLGLVGRFVTCGSDAGPPEHRVAVRADRAIGKVSLTLLDHHGDPMGSPATLDADAQWRAVAFSPPAALANKMAGAEALDVYVHDLAVAQAGHGAFHQTSSPSAYSWQEGEPDARLRRPHGTDDIAIGASPLPPRRYPMVLPR